MATLLPANLSKRLPAFKAWLEQCGAEMLAPTNEYEVLRFKHNGQTGVIYKNKQGRLTTVGGADKVWAAFVSGASWSGTDKQKRVKISLHIKTIIERDGDLCFFCGFKFGDDATVDHLVPLAHGGPNHISNFVLMHSECNAHCGCMTAMEKIRAHVEWHQIGNAAPSSRQGESKWQQRNGFTKSPLLPGFGW